VSEADAGSALGPEKLLGATFWRVTFLLVQGGGSVVLAAVLSHILDARAFATTLLAQGVLVIAQAIGDFGLSQAAVTLLPARIAAAPSSAASLRSGVAHAYVYAAVAAFALTLASTSLVPAGAVVAIAVSAPAAAATVLVGGADGLLRAQGHFRRPVTLVAASELGGFAGIPVAAASHSAVWTCAAIAAGTTAGAFGSVTTLRHHLRRPGSARDFLRAAAPLGMVQVFVSLATRFDSLLAASIPGVIAAGTFEGAWRIYQLGQYAAGALATAAAPFIAHAFGAGETTRALVLLRRLLLRLLATGVLAGAVIYLARMPLAHLLAGSLARPVAGSLWILAVTSPVTAVGIPAAYALIALDGDRTFLLGSFALGAVVNLALGIILATPLRIHGILIGCAAGAVLTSTLLLWRLTVAGKRVRRGAAPFSNRQPGARS
jgi:O-antigen/teichoic acid export membrane protein